MSADLLESHHLAASIPPLNLCVGVSCVITTKHRPTHKEHLLWHAGRDWDDGSEHTLVSARYKEAKPQTNIIWISQI